MTKSARIFAVLLVAICTWAQNEHRVERITDGPRVKEVTETVAKIAWSTTAAGSSIVRYGFNPHDLDQRAEEPWGGGHESNGNFNHTVWLKNLRPHTRYFFSVESGQARGTGTEAISNVEEFHTR
jgi:hypothetical protein